MAISESVKALAAGLSVPKSKLSSKIIADLLNEGLLIVDTHGSKQAYRARNVEMLKQYLIDSDEKYRLLDIQSTETRADMASQTGNSKLTTVRSCPGFLVNTYSPINCHINGKPLLIAPQEGTFVFVSEWKTFSIPTDITIIGIENMENFRLIRQQKSFFEQYLTQHNLPTTALFVSRYPQSTDLRKWLLSCHNHYLHFGDFDLAGIHIFQSEFQQHIGQSRCSFLIPDDIATRLQHGSSQRYDSQYARYKDIYSTDPELQSLIDLINHYHKGYDQEGYIA